MEQNNWPKLHFLKIVFITLCTTSNVVKKKIKMNGVNIKEHLDFKTIISNPPRLLLVEDSSS